MKNNDVPDTMHALEERIKELNCIYGISTLIQDAALSEKETISKVLKLIQQAWQYPDITSVRIAFGPQWCGLMYLLHPPTSISVIEGIDLLIRGIRRFYNKPRVIE